MIVIKIISFNSIYSNMKIFYFVETYSYYSEILKFVII